jgi:hypothetical protein
MPLLSIATSGLLLTTLNRGYDAAIEGTMGMSSAVELAGRFGAREGSLGERVDSLIKWQVATTTVCGTLFGLAGPVATLATPVSIALLSYLQLRMIAAVAHMGGHEVRSQHVRSFAYMCLCGDGGRGVLTELGFQIGAHLSKRVLVKVQKHALELLNETVAKRLLQNWGKKGLVGLGEAAPLVGACVGGFFDGRSTHVAGRAARDLFLAA